MQTLVAAIADTYTPALKLMWSCKKHPSTRKYMQN